MASILDEYVHTAPNPQAALDVMRGTWTSLVPIPGTQSGAVQLFDDDRIRWAARQFGGFRRKRVLELGPLEGAHTFQIERAGARSITAIEGNQRSYVKCLIVKELLGLSRARFLLGEIMAYLESSPDTFDIVFGSGVLYHMREPLRMLKLCAMKAPRLFIWTHYYDAAVFATKPDLAKHLKGDVAQCVEGFRCTGQRWGYEDSLAQPGFCGGGAESSVWLAKADIVGFLEHLGFTRIETTLDHPHHPNGPAFCIAAQRKAGWLRRP